MASALSQKLADALKSRDRRLIRRRLPELPSDSLAEIDFTSNDYLSLSTSPALRNAVLAALSAAPKILGSGGSRLLVPSKPHADLEARLCRFFDADAALLFNSGFDANVGFFSAVPQPGDVVLYDAHIHASVHDGVRLSRLAPDSLLPFPHNSVVDLRLSLAKLVDDRESLKNGKSSIFVAVESLYSMDGTIAPLTQIVECVERMLPMGNGHVVVDEAHSTGIYGPNGRGLVAELGLENRVYARLHTFGKALAASGAVLLTTQLVKDYLLNYARSLIYTTALPFANIVAVNCSFDLLEDGTADVLSAHLLALSTYFVDLLREELEKFPVSLLSLPEHLAPTKSEQAGKATPSRPTPWDPDPPEKIKMPRPTERSSGATPQNPKKTTKKTLVPTSPTLPTPIIPILTPEPRSLSSFLLRYYAASSSPPPPVVAVTPTSDDAPPRPGAVALHTKPIFPPTVPRGTARVRICLHAGHGREDVDMLVRGIVAWAEQRMAEERRGVERWRLTPRDAGVDSWMATKL